MINELISEWKPIEEFSNYQVNELGDVKNIKTGKILTPADSNGYSVVSLSEGKKRKTALIHRLVATAFIPNPEKKKTVNHLNGDKKDNRVSNLEWATDKENIEHCMKVLKNKKPVPNQILKELRIKRGYTQAQLSSLSGVGVPQLQKIETGKIKFENTTVKNALTIAKALGVTVEELLEHDANS